MNYFKTFLLMLAMIALCMFVGELVGGLRGAAFAFILAAVMNFAMYWGSDKMVIAMHRAVEVGAKEAPGLYRAVQRLSQAGNLPMPRIYVFDSDQPNAFATGRNVNHAAVAASRGLLEMMPQNEIEAVLAHELAHIKHRDMLISTVAAVMAGAIMMLGRMAWFAELFAGGRRSDNDRGGGGLAALVLIILAPLAAMIIQLAISRSREYAADEGSAALTGDPSALRKALERIHRTVEEVPMDQAAPAMAHMYIVNPFSREGFLANLFSTHPSLSRRVKRLEEIADRKIVPVF
jgi:heat shock protein HtpX